jgi:pyridoxamine 5'-phosphate oxidase
VLLLKGIEEGKFVFYTNYESAKAGELQVNSRAALTFLWLPLQRQIRIEGAITKISSQQSDDYFQKRPRGSQLGAIASPQSRKVNSREEIEQLFRVAEEKFSSFEKIPRPQNWGGYAIEASYLEFWQGRNNRLHDRICYEKTGLKWERFRLAP